MLVFKFIRTRLRQSPCLVKGLQPYSHASTSTERYGKRLKTRTAAKRKSLMVSTLDQHKLLPSDFLSHLSNRARPGVRFLNVAKDMLKDPRLKHTCILPACRWQFGYFDMDGKPTPFPPNSSGFLYYHQPQGAPLLSGEVRFRLTPNNLPESFSQGEDCLIPHGDIWKIPLLSLHSYKTHQDVYRQLQLDGFVSDALHSKLKTVAKTCPCPRHSAVILHSLHQVFPVDFALAHMNLFVVGDSTYRRVLLHCPFLTQVIGYKKDSPFTSKGLARFELSKLPEHAGTKTVVMRVVKLVGDPGPYLGEDRPQEGALVLRHNPAGGQPRVFRLRVDPSSSENGPNGYSHPDALPLLLENTFRGEHSTP
ncbi:uncharacterized protein LACBIDRAFT_308127 [Laccaria bicolor S238N-H82]|uniref:Predicted protein n=1 Tax=Laccaria bicolor (strain S238N-H82 / ATCC MYA-4686) TaxID=486041 RepID=B0CWV9_LACBS|nr:uncharacterized protein LACBIDRAFT_308649 [Laccaria bicolor S238N-H82]XP_001891143.1 uncharacterized protein LACBIDRAFT_308127 [Laccaria bicolor S238N-H82]EDQ98206.1 predicted protein [Laccaria bicolor S238N-H82]EDR13141.1 predicted protein [Laccaria bicolor S238N-H82]|eukprot:XP_001875639.1 predicted protein [Laccaria bicolor S238N-H82]